MNPIINGIIAAFEGFRMSPTNIDEWGTGGRDTFATQLDSFVGAGKKIEFRMMGYPFKSKNTLQKVIGQLPDLGEEASFEQFRRFCRAIKAVYEPGAIVHLVSDGLMFNRTLEIEDRTVDEYYEINHDLASCDLLHFMSLRDFYPGLLVNEARDKARTQFGITDTELERRILTDANVNALYRGIMRFMEEEIGYKTFPSNRRREKEAKRIAREVMSLNEAYSALAEHELPQAIRLSMHPSTNNKKYAFALIPGPKAWASPWHCALLVHPDGLLETIHRDKADAAGHRLVERHGRPYFYEVAA